MTEGWCMALRCCTGRRSVGGLQQVGVPVAQHLQALANLCADGGGAELLAYITRSLRAQALGQFGLAGKLA